MQLYGGHAPGAGVGGGEGRVRTSAGEENVYIRGEGVPVVCEEEQHTKAEKEDKK